MREKKLQPVHISQAFDLSSKEGDLDFFDANLLYDSRLFIDPFLLKRSPIQDEKEIFKRFGVFFKHVHKESLGIRGDYETNKLIEFLDFHEPKEINLGYTEKSNKGKGPGSVLASSLLHFFLESSAQKIILKDDLYPDKEFNPVILTTFVDHLGPDGISDLIANLIMDYLIKYTQKECRKWNIKLKKNLPIQQSFDFHDMEWTSGIHADLPENPLRPGEPIVFVPKHLLRGEDSIKQGDAKSKIIGILKNDPILKDRFFSFISQKINEITIKEIRTILLTDESLLKRFIEVSVKKNVESYDFERDILEILAIKKYYNYFEKTKIDQEIKNCHNLFEHTQKLIKGIRKELLERDGWKDMWINNKPVKEIVFGRKFRGMGYAYFRWLPEITFDAQIGVGSGVLDFRIIHKDCRIALELKLLKNASSSGTPPLKAYLHGITRQLPKYILDTEANYGVYITGQHYNETGEKKAKNHSSRVDEIKKYIPKVKKDIKTKLPQFEELLYENIDLSPKSTTSKL